MQSSLHDSAVEVAHRLTQLDSYGGSAPRALKALERRHPGREPEEYAEALERAVALFARAREMVEENVTELWSRYRAEERVEVGPLVPVLGAAFPEFSPASCSSALAWMFYFWHLR